MTNAIGSACQPEAQWLEDKQEQDTPLIYLQEGETAFVYLRSTTAFNLGVVFGTSFADSRSS